MPMDHSTFSPTVAKTALLMSRDDFSVRNLQQDLLQECVLSVWINGKLSLKMVCTPSDLKALIVGHLISEGLISSCSDIEKITVDEKLLSAYVETDSQSIHMQEPLEIRACDCGANGILGRSEIDSWSGSSAQSVPLWNPEDIFVLADAFREQTPIYKKTKGIHSCLLMYEGSIRYCCEDIGRHNALDKVIGYAALDGLSLENCIVYSSGRIPEDMIAKIIRSGIPVLVSKATPTSRAVDLARRYHVALICGAHPDSMKVFSCRELWDLPISAGILAGGNSSRMGTNKTLLDSCGETFLAHIQKQCSFLSETIVSVRCADQLPDVSIPYVLDEKQNYGPLEGIYQILKAANNPYVLILAVDMQCVDSDFLRNFLSNLNPEDECMVLKSANGLEPLCSVYSKAILPVLEQLRTQDIRRPRLLFERVNTHYVTAADLMITEEELSLRMNNINTPEDYQAYLKNNR